MKRLDQMNRLVDMGNFPVLVHLGASLNIVFTIWLTWVVREWTQGELAYLMLTSFFLILINILPVVFLRIKTLDDKTVYPNINEMNFFHDQHKFSSWVYAIASANMFFWIVLSWCVFNYSSEETTLVLLQIFSFLITFVPLWRSRIVWLVKNYKL
jgi:hypothetical protein